MFFDRNTLGQYQIVGMSLDHNTIEEARNVLADMMNNYVRDDDALKKEGRTTDFFTVVADKQQIHPNFMRLSDMLICR